MSSCKATVQLESLRRSPCGRLGPSRLRPSSLALHLSHYGSEPACGLIDLGLGIRSLKELEQPLARGDHELGDRELPERLQPWVDGAQPRAAGVDHVVATNIVLDRPAAGGRIVDDVAHRSTLG